jgi:hypothetical protein
MISDCAGLRQWDLSDTEAIFVQGVFALLKILIPVAIWVYTWKVCRPERAHPRTSMLGLEETTAQREQDAQKRSRV